jgi:hypothetical protein
VTQENWTIRFSIPDSLVFPLPDDSTAFFVLCQEDVEGGLWALLRLAALILLPLMILQTLRLDHPWWPLFSYDDLLAFG